MKIKTATFQSSADNSISTDNKRTDLSGNNFSAANAIDGIIEAKTNIAHSKKFDDDTNGDSWHLLNLDFDEKSGGNFVHKVKIYPSEFLNYMRYDESYSTTVRLRTQLIRVFSDFKKF